MYNCIILREGRDQDLSDTKREIRKYTDFVPDEIKDYLAKFRKFILGNKYSIEQNENRRENIDFIEDYKIDTKKEKEILLCIQYDDFCIYCFIS